MWNVVAIRQAREMGGVNVIPLTANPLLEQQRFVCLAEKVRTVCNSHPSQATNPSTPPAEPRPLNL